MIFYHTILQIWRVRTTKRPHYLRNMFHPDYEHHTRNITTGNLRTTEMKTGLGKKAIRVRGATYWNSLPPELKGLMANCWVLRKSWRPGSRLILRCKTEWETPAYKLPASAIIDCNLNDVANKSIYLCDARAAQVVTTSITHFVAHFVKPFLKQLVLSQFRSDLSQIWNLSSG